MRIIGPPSGDQARVRIKLIELQVHPRFLNEMFEHLWDEAVMLNVDPVGMVAQSYKETGRGNFSGNVTPQFYNTAGIKVRHLGKFPGVDDGDRPLAHAQFANWRQGALAQAQHLRAYAGWPLEEYELIVDPRYSLVSGRWIEEWKGLGGAWAPSPTYGVEIETLMAQLRA